MGLCLVVVLSTILADSDRNVERREVKEVVRDRGSTRLGSKMRGDGRFRDSFGSLNKANVWSGS